MLVIAGEHQIQSLIPDRRWTWRVFSFSSGKKCWEDIIHGGLQPFLGGEHTAYVTGRAGDHSLGG